MNSEFSPTPQEELEAQITSLLLGEMPGEEATALRERIAADPELRKLHTQIEMTIGLVKEAIASPQSAEIVVPEGLRLSKTRREKLLASFKVVKVLKRDFRTDFKTWGALAAMVAGLLSFSYWMVGAFFVKARHSARQMAAVEHVESGASLPQTETQSLLFSPPTSAATEPARREVLVSGSSAQENAPQGVRFKEVGQAANAEAAGSESVEESRVAGRYRIELPEIAAESAPVIQDPASTGVVPENPLPVSPKSQSANMRGFFDESAAVRTTTEPAGTEPAAASSPSAFGVVLATPATGPESDLKEMKGDVPAPTEIHEVSGIVGQRVNVIPGTDVVHIGGGLQIAQQDSERFGRRLDSRQLGEREIVLNPDFDKAKGVTERPSQAANERAEGKLAAISPAPADRVQDLEQLKKAPAESVTTVSDPLAFYRRNPELMKRYFPHLPAADEAQPQLKKLEGTSAGTPETSEVEKLRSDVKTPELLRDSVATSISKGDDIIPESQTVQIVEPAEAKGLTFWERFRGAERTALVEKRNEGPDLGSIVAAPKAYDPYFIQTEAEKVKSDAVLGDVVDNLNLSQEWGNKAGGQKLEKKQAIRQLRKMVNVEQSTAGLIGIKVRSKDSEEAARIANAVADAYKENSRAKSPSQSGIAALELEGTRQESTLAKTKAELQRLEAVSKADAPAAKPVANAPVPQPEVAVATNPFSTFSLNVSDVSFKLAAASLEKGQMPDAAAIRSEEFINAFDYRDPAALSAPVAFAWERARYPFAHDRDLLRFSVKSAASGRESNRPLNLVLLLDSSGSMERADRVQIIQECLRVLAGQLQAQDKVSVVTFARTPRLWVDGLAGSSAGELVTRIGTVTPEGGTNLEEAMRVGYETAARHFVANGVNRVVLLTDGAANLGEVNAALLKTRVEENRQKGIALDCFGIGWEGLNDDLLEQLSRNGDGRYGFVNTREAASAEFAGQLAGALKVAASDVKVQVEFNPKRATAYRQIGYAKHQLAKEQFRDNTVDAAEIGAAEAGNAVYVVQTNPAGEGPIATVRVRFKVPGTSDYREHEWPVPYEGAAKPLERSSPGIRLAAAASGFSEWLAASPYAGEITPDRLLGAISNVPGAFPNDPRPKQLEWMIRQAKSIAGK